MRAEAAVKAWARVAAVLAEASQGAAKEYAGARRAKGRTPCLAALRCRSVARRASRGLPQETL